MRAGEKKTPKQQIQSNFIQLEQCLFLNNLGRFLILNFFFFFFSHATRDFILGGFKFGRAEETEWKEKNK